MIHNEDPLGSTMEIHQDPPISTIGIVDPGDSALWILVDPHCGFPLCILVDPHCGSWQIFIVDPGRSSLWIPCGSWWIPIVHPGGSPLWILVDPHCGSWLIPIVDPGGSILWILLGPGWVELWLNWGIHKCLSENLLMACSLPVHYLDLFMTC